MPGKTDNPVPDWPGFTGPAYTQIPDELFDVWLPHLSGAELKVLLYICRRTFGWKKEADAISLGQITSGIRRRDGSVLDSGTGLSRSTVMAAIAGLEAKTLIIVERSATAAQDQQANVYRLRMQELGRKSIQHSATQIGNRSSPGSNRAPALDRKSAPQETRQETTQEGDQGLSLVAILSDYGGAWATLQPQAAALCAARGWSPAQLAQALASRAEQGLRAKLAALAGG